MTVITCWGALADATGMALIEDEYGRRDHISCPSTQYRRTQARAGVHVAHQGPEIGRVEHLALTRDKQLLAVAVIDLDDTVTAHARDDPPAAAPLYWSPAIRRNADGTIDLLEASLTRSPASIGLRPVRTLAGDLRYRSVRRSWQLPSDYLERMLEDAATSLEHRGPIMVNTSTSTPQPVTRAAGTTAPELRRLRHATNPGGMFYSRGGRVLAVH